MKKFILWGLLIFIGLGVLGFVFGIIGEGASVAKKEFGPKAALKKYEYFINTSEALDAKFRTITVYEGNLTSMTADYKDVSRKDWDRVDKQQFNQWNMEIAGIKASYIC